MIRREFVGAGAFIATASVLPDPARDDAAAIKQAVEDYYAVYRGGDKAKYRALLTDDYLLLENGEMLDAAGDLAAMAPAGSGYQRNDSFAFRLVKAEGSLGYAVYVLASDITDQQGPRHREYLESMILRRSGRGWRVSLLHSTRVSKPGT